MLLDVVPCGVTLMHPVAQNSLADRSLFRFRSRHSRRMRRRELSLKQVFLAHDFLETASEGKSMCNKLFFIQLAHWLL